MRNCLRGFLLCLAGVGEAADSSRSKPPQEQEYHDELPQHTEVNSGLPRTPHGCCRNGVNSFCSASELGRRYLSRSGWSQCFGRRSVQVRSDQERFQERRSVWTWPGRGSWPERHRRLQFHRRRGRSTRRRTQRQSEHWCQWNARQPRWSCLERRKPTCHKRRQHRHSKWSSLRRKPVKRLWDKHASLLKEPHDKLGTTDLQPSLFVPIQQPFRRSHHEPIPVAIASRKAKRSSSRWMKIAFCTHRPNPSHRKENDHESPT